MNSNPNSQPLDSDAATFSGESGKIGVGSWTFPWAVGTVKEHRPQTLITPVNLVRKARDLGAKVVQIGDNLPINQFSKGDLNELRVVADECCIELEVGTRGVEPSHLLRYLKIAQFLKARLVRTMAGWPGANPPLEKVKSDLREVLPQFSEAGVSIGLENYETYSTGELARLVRAVDNPSLGVCLDVSNSLGALESIDAILDALLPLTINVHIKDISVERLPYLMGFAFYGRPAGQGRIPFEQIFARLEMIGRKPNAIIELWTPFRGSLEQTLDLEEDWARASIEYLSKLPWFKQ
ncbi:MAG: sugar phosphate isomerase/epimerase [Verrucomicrobia bacterium]|nr:sugar phosphate isomerase/epimerase [Verrucomicrobiota bacterium]